MTTNTIAEALPRTRGLKYIPTHPLRNKKADCRGIAPNEGTEIWLPMSLALVYKLNCRGIAPNEGTEIYYLSRGLVIKKLLQRHCPERGD